MHETNHDLGREPELFHQSLSPEHPESIILLHGATGSHVGWEGISDELAKTYHVLVPDAPGHSGSRSMGTWSLAAAVNRHAALIQHQANGGRAHVVGFSMGGFTALVLAQKYPHLLQSLFVTGAYDMQTGWGWKLRLAPFVSSIQRYLVPDALEAHVMRKMGLRISEKQRVEGKRNADACRGNNDLYDLALPPRAKPGEWQLSIRSLVVAGAKQDPLDATRMLANELRKGNSASQWAVVVNGQHWWSAQFPKLFTDAVSAWIKEEPLPSGLDMQDTA